MTWPLPAGSFSQPLVIQISSSPAMKLPISVVMTSSVPERMRSQPGQKAQSAPKAMPSRRARRMTKVRGRPGSKATTTAAPIAPR